MRRWLAEDEQALTDAIVELASRFGRYGYRRITALLRMEGCMPAGKYVHDLPCLNSATNPACSKSRS